MTGVTPAELTLHIDGPAAKEHAIPAAVLVQVLSNFQRVAELVGMHVEGKGIKDRARVPSAISRKFRLVCKLPHEGSYAIPISFGDQAADIFAPAQIHEAWNLLTGAMKSVYAKQVETIRTLFPDAAFRVRILDAIRGMAPSPGAGWVLQLRQHDGVRFAELDEGVGEFIDKAIRLPERRESEDTVTGELRSIDFKARKVMIIHPVTNKILDCFYDETIEDLLYDNRRQLIQVTGRVILDADGNPREILDVSSIKDMDLSPFELDRVNGENKRLKTKIEISLEPKLDETSQFMFIEDDALGVMAYGKTREALRDDLHSQIAMMWREYALEDDEELTEDAIERKHFMLSAFEEARDAA